MRGGGLLTALSLVSVGYSTWEINRQSVVSGGEMSADDVIDINQHFSFEGNPEVFDYASDGFVYNDVIDPSVVNEGNVTFPFQLDVGSDKISDHLPTGASNLTLRVVLLDKNPNLSLFSVCEVTKAKLSVNTKENIRQYSLVSSVSKTDAEGKYSQWDFPLDDSYLSQPKVFFAVRYTLRFTVNSSAEGNSFSFKTDVYDKLDEGSFKFSLKAGVVL